MKIIFLTFLLLGLMACGSKSVVRDVDSNEKDRNGSSLSAEERSKDPRNSHSRWDPRTGKWVKKGPFDNKWGVWGNMPFGNNAFGIVRVKSKVYIAGGYAKSGYQNTFIEFDLKSKKWTTLAPMPEVRAGLTLEKSNGKIYALGGVSPKGASKTVYAYDLKSKKWEKAPDLQRGRYQHASVVLKDRIYLIGGVGQGKSVIYLKPNGKKWIKGPALNEGRDSHAAVVYNGGILVLGGKRGSIILDSVEYLGKSKRWLTYDTAQINRFGFSSLPYLKNIIIIGGFRDISARSYHSSTVFYRVQSKKMYVHSQLPVGLANFGAITYKSSAYLFGGRNFKGLQKAVLRMDIRE